MHQAVKPAFRLLIDMVHRVFLSQIGTNEQVTMYKFKLMVVIYKNLNVNWACILLSNINEEMKKIVRKFDDKGLVMELVLKNRLNLCTKISLLILTNVQCAEWTGSMEFDKDKCLPKDAHQFQMMLGINNNSLL